VRDADGGVVGELLGLHGGVDARVDPGEDLLKGDARDVVDGTVEGELAVPEDGGDGDVAVGAEFGVGGHEVDGGVLGRGGRGRGHGHEGRDGCGEEGREAHFGRWEFDWIGLIKRGFGWGEKRVWMGVGDCLREWEMLFWREGWRE